MTRLVWRAPAFLVCLSLSFFLFLRKQMGGSRGGIPRNSDQSLKQSEAHSAPCMVPGPEVHCFTKRALHSRVNSFALASMRTGAAPRRQRTAPPRRAARTCVRTIGAGQRALRNREETKIYLVYLLLCFWYTIFSAPEEPRTAEVPRALGSRQPRVFCWIAHAGRVFLLSLV